MVKQTTMNKKNTLLAAFILLMSCASQKTATTAANTNTQSNLIPDGKLFTSMFQQKAAEYKALCFQAYNIAHLRLDQMLLQQHSKPLAVVTDIDETVLDNSPYAVHQALLGKGYEDSSWMVWSKMIKADTVPGAHTFFTYAASKNVEVFYVTNRAEKERASTLKNLQLFNFPNADDKHLLLRTDTSSKEPRRQSILQTHDIIMLCGDNLGDLSSVFDDKQFDTRLKNTQMLASEFGNKFIVLPNANYGDWENSFYNLYKPMSKDSVIKTKLTTF